MKKRLTTRYTGVFYREHGGDKSFFVVFRKAGKVHEVKIGNQSDGMTACKASAIRHDYMCGKLATRQEAKERAIEKIWSIGELWLEYKKQHLSGKSLLTDQSRYQTFLKHDFETKTPDQLTQLDIERLKRKLIKTYSPQTVKHVLSLLNRLINFGVHMALTEPLRFKILMPKVFNVKDDSLNLEQLKNLYEAIKQDKHPQAGNMMLLCLYSGLRRSEILKLKWSNINFENNFIKIIDAKSGHDEIIPLNTKAKTLLQNHIKKNGVDFIFFGRDNKQRTTIPKAVIKIRDAANLPKHIRPLHSLRHTFASMAVNSGMDLFVVQKLLTHKSIAITQRYAHLSNGILQTGSQEAADHIHVALNQINNCQIVNLIQ